MEHAHHQPPVVAVAKKTSVAALQPRVGIKTAASLQMGAAVRSLVARVRGLIHAAVAVWRMSAAVFQQPVLLRTRTAETWQMGAVARWIAVRVPDRTLAVVAVSRMLVAVQRSKRVRARERSVATYPAATVAVVS